MPLMREHLHGPQVYYARQDLVLVGKGAWRAPRAAPSTAAATACE